MFLTVPTLQRASFAPRGLALAGSCMAKFANACPESQPQRTPYWLRIWARARLKSCGTSTKEATTRSRA